MRTRNLILVTIVATVLAAVAGTLAGEWTRSRSEPPPTPEAQHVVVIDRRSLDFGERWATTRFEWRLPVQNVSATDATLESLIGDCSCLSIDGLPLHLQSGEVGYVRLNIDLMGRCMGVGAEPFGSIPYPIKLSGTVRVREAQQAVSWDLTGRVKPAILLSRRRVDFGRLWNPHSGLERKVILRTAPGIEVDSAKVEGDSRSITTDLRPTKTRDWELVVVLDPRMPPGRYQAAISIVPKTTAGALLGAIRLPVEWENLHEIQADTSTIDFGVQPVGSVSMQTLTLTSLAGKPFRITRCELGGRGLMKADPAIDEAATSIVLSLRQKVDHAGDQGGEITVSGVTATGEGFTVKCQTRYYGLSSTEQ